MKRQQAMLDALMGESRNLPAKERKGDDFNSSKVCKYFLLGFCPDQLMAKHIEEKKKEDLFAYENRPHIPAPCKKDHPEPMKALYEKHANHDGYKREYEAQLIKRLEDIIADVDRFASITKAKCRPKERILRLSDVHAAEVEDWKEQQKQHYLDAKLLGESGNVAGAAQHAREAERLQSFIDDRVEYGTIYFPGESCCDICAGKYLNGELQPGLEKGLSGFIWEADHPNQKMHKGYVKIRDKLAELKENRTKYEDAQKRDKQRDEERGADKGRAEKGKDVGRNEKQKDAGSRKSRGRDSDRNGRDARGGDRGRSGRRGRESRSRGRESHSRGRGRRSGSRKKDLRRSGSRDRGRRHR